MSFVTRIALVDFLSNRNRTTAAPWKSNRLAILYYDKTGLQEMSDMSQTLNHELEQMQVCCGGKPN